MHILVIPPVGDTPWASQQTLVDALRDEGHAVDVADLAGGVFPQPAAYTPPPRAADSTASFVASRARAYRAFLRHLRQLLAAEQYDLLLTWAPFWAIAARVARPRTTRVAWVMSERPPARRRHSLERHLTSLVVDTLVVPDGRRTLANLGRQVVAAPIDDSAVPESLAPHDIDARYVVFATAPSLDGVALLSAESHRRTAAAVIIDGRGADGAITNDDVVLQTVSGAAEFDVAFDGGWIERHCPAFVFDPSPVITRLDHRHRAAFQAGLPVRVPSSTIATPVAELVDVVARGGWSELRPHAPRGRTIGMWAEDAVRDPVCPRWEFVERYGKPVSQCPACDSPDRTTLAIVQRSTTIHRCTECGLRYASPKVPDELVYTAGYHDGSGMFGSDYTVASWYFDRLSDGRLEYLARAGVTPSCGRLVDLGTGIGHFVGRARTHGWHADGVEISGEAIDFARREFGIDLIEGRIDTFRPAPRYAVATLGQTLEHFVHPGALLDHIREHVLEPGGFLFVELPHVDGLPRRLRRGNWAHWQPGDHVSFFTRPGLEELMRTHGFEVLACDTITFPSPGAIGALYTLGLFDATTSWGSALRLVTRWSRKKVPLLRASALPVSLAEAPNESAPERLLKAAARAADRAGLGDHIQIVVRAR
jgi:SAM-dependent methyltransferase